MKFSLIKGDIEEFAILEETIPDNLNDLFVENNIKVKVDVVNKKIALVNVIKYVTNDKSLLKITAVLYFKIDETSWSDMIKGDEIIIEKEKIQHLGTITIGATRGMLIAKCMNTPFSTLTLPLVSIDDLLFDDIVFNKNITA